MKKRSVAAVIILSFITVFIYEFVWLYKTRNGLIKRGGQIPSFQLLLTPLYVLVGVALLALIGHLIFDSGGAAINVLLALGGIIGVALAIGIPVYWFLKYCRAAEAVTGGLTSSSTSFLLWIILSIFGVGFVWPGIMQDSFNKISDGPAPGVPNPQYPPQPQQQPPQY